VARYLGPAEFGILSYCYACIGLLAGISTLGWDRLIIRDLVQNKEPGSSIIATQQIMRIIGAITSGALAVAIIFLSKPDDQISLAIILILAFANLVMSLNAVEVFFHASLKIGLITPIKMIALLFSALLRVCVVFYDGTIIHLALIGLLESMIIGCGLVWRYRQLTGGLSFLSINMGYLYRLIKEGWPLFLALQLNIFAERIYGVALNGYLEEIEYGQFMLAFRLVEIPLTLLYLSTISFLPSLTRLRELGISELENKILLYTEIGTVAGMLSWLFIIILGPSAIVWIFGSQFAGTGSILVFMWGAVFIQANALFRAHYLIIEGSPFILMLGNLMGLLISVPLAMLFINQWGWQASGGAFSISIFVMYFLSGAFSPRGRRVMMLQVKALSFPNLRNNFKSFNL
jgi:O-antigen/teichoic acid export membrane protein